MVCDRNCGRGWEVADSEEEGGWREAAAWTSAAVEPDPGSAGHGEEQDGGRWVERPLLAASCVVMCVRC